MACFHPLDAIIIPGQKTINGKQSIKIVNSLFGMSKVPEELRLKLPCGQCAGCRMQRSREWANRCMMELQYHKSSYFVTLTYDNDHVPRSFVTDPDTGEALQEHFTLCKRDFQLFMKRLRKRFSDQTIRFYMAGEYGSETFRPHYHAILFGLSLDDLVLYKKSPLGFSYYNSQSLSSCWCDHSGNPIGHVVVADVTWESCAYTARYIMKKQTGEDAHIYSDLNIEPEFTLMSRKPGIARQYYDDHPGICEFDFIYLSSEKKGLKFRPPRYFDKLYEMENPEALQEKKDVRKKIAIAQEKQKLERTTLFAEELRAVEERAFENRIKSLRRNLV